MLRMNMLRTAIASLVIGCAAAQAQSDGFLSGYGTTTMQDCCRPHCAWDVNVAQGGVSVDPQFNRFYSCGHDGVPH